MYRHEVASLRKGMNMSIDLEKVLLGALLSFPKRMSEVRTLLSPQDFSNDRNRLVFAGMNVLFERNGTFDDIMLTDHLHETGDLENVGSYISGLIYPTDANLKSHAEIIQRKAQEQKRSKLHEKLINVVQDGKDLDGAKIIIDRMQGVDDGLDPHLTTWATAQPASEFVSESENEPEWLYPEILAPGSITEIFSPRGIGKTHVAYAIAIDLAKRGKRILLIDRDNSRQEVKRRLKAWGAAEIDASTLKVMTRDQSPPLTDQKAWKSFPFAEYDLVIIDSLDSSTEGVGEQDSAKPSRAIAPLLDIAHRADGPAILILGNTVKSGAHSRGSGIVEDRADISYEVRDATGFSPTGSKPWWEELPESGAGTWAKRSTRRNRRDTYRLAFVSSKFRVGEEPDPFIFEVDLSSKPWILRNVTAEVISEALGAVGKKAEEQESKLDAAASALTLEIDNQAKAGVKKFLVKDAIPLLIDRGLTRDEARQLVKDQDGQDWSIQTLASERGKPKVLLPIKRENEGEPKEDGVNNSQSQRPDLIITREPLISADPMDTRRPKYKVLKPALGEDFVTSPLFTPEVSDPPQNPRDGESNGSGSIAPPDPLSDSKALFEYDDDEGVI